MLTYWRSEFWGFPPPPPGGVAFNKILEKIKQVFPAFVFPHNPPADAKIAVRELYCEYVQFLERETPPNEWTHAKEFLLWTKVSWRNPEPPKLDLNDVAECLNNLWPSTANQSLTETVQSMMKRTINICKPFFDEDDIFNRTKSYNNIVDELMDTDASFAMKIGYNSKTGENIALGCLSRVSAELFDDVDFLDSAPKAAQFKPWRLIHRLKGDFFARYSGAYWSYHLAAAARDDCSPELYQAVQRMLSKFESRYNETGAQVDFGRWCSFTFSAFTTGAVGKLFPEALVVQLLKGLKHRYEAEPTGATFDDWIRCARMCEGVVSSPEPEGLIYMHHLEEALIESHAQTGDDCVLEELTRLYEKWESRFHVRPSSRYSLAFREWLEATGPGEYTGHFSIGSSGEGPVQLQVRYPWRLITVMLNRGVEFRKLVDELPGAYVCIGIDMLPPEVKPARAEHGTIFKGEKALYFD
jgi:hypothetical protein